MSQPQQQQHAPFKVVPRIAYVLGFMVSQDGVEVALIRKQKPEEQKGKLNGIGGKIEPTDESPHHAMAREYKEETGVETRPTQWHWIGRIRFSGGEIFIFRALGNDFVEQQPGETEKPAFYKFEDLRGENVMDNLEWLLPLVRTNYARISFDLQSPNA